MSTKRKTGIWRPISQYFEGGHDWALVRFREKQSGFVGLPHLCEHRKSDQYGEGWYSQDAEHDKALFEYLNVECEAVAFLEWDDGLLCEILEDDETLTVGDVARIFASVVENCGDLKTFEAVRSKVTAEEFDAMMATLRDSFLMSAYVSAPQDEAEREIRMYKVNREGETHGDNR